MYKFSFLGTRSIIVQLTDIPEDNNYDLFLYDSNKQLLATSDNPGNLGEYINRTLLGGAYYLVAKRSYGQAQPDKSYRIIVYE